MGGRSSSFRSKKGSGITFTKSKKTGLNKDGSFTEGGKTYSKEYLKGIVNNFVEAKKDRLKTISKLEKRLKNGHDSELAKRGFRRELIDTRKDYDYIDKEEKAARRRYGL